jgi:polyphosphate kinase
LNTRFDPELSRLDFEDRLIELCEDARRPLLERVRLLGIAAGRIDVFFMTRVGRLKRLIAAGGDKRSSIATLTEQLVAVSVEAHRMTRRAYRLLKDDLLPALAAEQIRIERYARISDADKEWLRRTYGPRVAAAIRPANVGARDAFPHVRNLRPAIIGVGAGADTGTVVVIEAPADVPRLLQLHDEHRFVPVEQMIAADLSRLCHDVSIRDAHLFRVTRNASTEFDDDEHDVLGAVEEKVEQRPFQEVVRLEIEATMPAALRARLVDVFQREADFPVASLREQDVYTIEEIPDLTTLTQLGSLDIPRLKAPPLQRRSTTIPRLLIDGTKPANALLHFPFDDYETSVERFLGEAAENPDLVSMEVAIYRTDEGSGVVDALRTARKRGADVTAVIELKASFDERENVELARTLEESGVQVILSPVKLKVHAKVALVTFRGTPEPRRVALIGTGNMNAQTARSYIDLWLATSDPACTKEVAAVFDILIRRSRRVDFDCLLVGPFNLRPGFLELIETEIGNAQKKKPAGIRAMMNGLTDSAIIDALYRASQAGVPIDLMARGVCLLRPGAKGMSENIRVTSVAGSLLQHARIFHFRNAGKDKYLIGSADWRPRNFDHRVEVVVHVSDRDHIGRLDRILTETLDSPEAWILGADGEFRPRKATSDARSAQGIRTYVTLSPT